MRASGLRLHECLLRWSEVDWTGGQIVKLGKRGQRVTVPITSDIRDVLWPLRGHHPEMVFTYPNVAQSRAKLARRPITYGGLQTLLATAAHTRWCRGLPLP